MDQLDIAQSLGPVFAKMIAQKCGIRSDLDIVMDFVKDDNVDKPEKPNQDVIDAAKDFMSMDPALSLKEAIEAAKACCC